MRRRPLAAVRVVGPRSGAVTGQQGTAARSHPMGWSVLGTPGTDRIRSKRLRRVRRIQDDARRTAFRARLRPSTVSLVHTTARPAPPEPHAPLQSQRRYPPPAPPVGAGAALTPAPKAKGPVVVRIPPRGRHPGPFALPLLCFRRALTGPSPSRCRARTVWRQQSSPGHGRAAGPRPCIDAATTLRRAPPARPRLAARLMRDLCMSCE